MAKRNDVGQYCYGSDSTKRPVTHTAQLVMGGKCIASMKAGIRQGITDGDAHLATEFDDTEP